MVLQQQVVGAAQNATALSRRCCGPLRLHLDGCAEGVRSAGIGDPSHQFARRGILYGERGAACRRPPTSADQQLLWESINAVEGACGPSWRILTRRRSTAVGGAARAAAA